MWQRAGGPNGLPVVAGTSDAATKYLQAPSGSGATQALRVKSAEYWLEHGQPDEALRGLEKLPRKAWDHPWAVSVRVAAVQALREVNGQAHAE